MICFEMKIVSFWVRFPARPRLPARLKRQLNLFVLYSLPNPDAIV